MKYKFKEIISAVCHCWECLAYLLVAIIVAASVIGYHLWLADGDLKCALAQDPATCSAVKHKGV